jgi:hypothetical protein
LNVLYDQHKAMAVYLTKQQKDVVDILASIGRMQASMTELRRVATDKELCKSINRTTVHLNEIESRLVKILNAPLPIFISEHLS